MKIVAKKPSEFYLDDDLGYLINIEHVPITPGKIYETLFSNVEYSRNWIIINDLGLEDCLSKRYFKTLSEVRDVKLNQLLK